MPKSYTLKWYGRKSQQEVEQAVTLFLQQWALGVEGAAKEQLYPGHGVITGTLRRSIHAADPDYNWPGDDLMPDESTPERGGQSVSPAKKGSKLVVSVGSGMVYARVIEKKYHYLANALRKMLDEAPRILKWAAYKLWR